MSWTRGAVDDLKAGVSVLVYPPAHTLRGRLKSKHPCRILPLKSPSDLTVDRVVLCKAGGETRMLILKDIVGERYLVGNTYGQDCGLIEYDAIFGVVKERDS